MKLLRPRTPLAWRNLVHNPRRLLLASGGIGFAVMLIFMQLGFEGALFDSTVLVPRHLNADLVMIDRAKFSMTVNNRFSRRMLSLAQSCAGVAEAHALIYDDRFLWQNVTTGLSLPIRLIAYDPLVEALTIPGIFAQQSKLLLPGTVLADRRSKSEYGPLTTGTISEYANQRAEIVGNYSLGTDFTNDGDLISSELTFARFTQPGRETQALESIDLGLVRLAPGYTAAEVLDRLKRQLPEDIRVLTKDDFVTLEQDFWRHSTPIGYIFSFGVVLGVFVGIIICYQVLFADISDHLPEFATLKAMGYRGRYFTFVVLEEALWLAMFGFLPGLAASVLLYALLAEITSLALELSWERAAGVFVLTVAMCVVSGIMTVRKVLSADPAELFA